MSATSYVARISSNQAKAARVLTLDRVEIAGAKGGPPQATIFARLQRYYEAASIEFTAGDPPVVNLKAGASPDAI